MRDPFRHQIKVGIGDFIELCVRVFGCVFVSVAEPYLEIFCVRVVCVCKKERAVLDLKPL